MVGAGYRRRHINGLEEVPPEEDNDDEVIDAVRLVLEKAPFVNASKMRVISKDRIVTLEGLVPNDTMRQMADKRRFQSIMAGERAQS